MQPKDWLDFVAGLSDVREIAKDLTPYSEIEAGVIDLENLPEIDCPELTLDGDDASETEDDL